LRSDTARSPFTRKGFWKVVATVCLAAGLALGVPGISPAVDEVRVGVYPNEPLIFKDKDGRIKGIYNDLLVHVAQKEKWNLKYVPGTWEECVERLNNHEIDLMAAIAYSEKRSFFTPASTAISIPVNMLLCPQSSFSTFSSSEYWASNITASAFLKKST